MFKHQNRGVSTPTMIFSFVILILLLATFVWMAGAFFYMFSGVNPLGQTGFTTWWEYYSHYQDDPAVYKKLKGAAMAAALVAFLLPLFIAVAAARKTKSLHGEARFANDSEIEKAGLYGTEGIIVGKHKNKFLLFPGSQFVILAAPTRSGKGIGAVIPNLLNYKESLVVLDVKLENFLITSKFRQQHGQEVFLFNPFSSKGETHRYNPLGYISNNPLKRVEEIMSIGYALYPGGGKDSFFDDAARNLFLGLTLYLAETPELPLTIGELLRQSSGKGQPIKDYLQELVNNRNYTEEEVTDDEGETETVLTLIEDWDGKGLAPLSMECVDALNRFTSTSDNTLSSILASFNVPLTIWVSPLVDAATSENDFDLRDIRKKRMTIYIGIPANKMAEAELVLNLFFSQLINLNTDELLHAKPELKHPVLLLMDEFTAPGRIGIIDKSNSYMAGYGLRLMTIIQSPGQLEAAAPKGYGRESARTLMTNHAMQILYTPRDQKDAEEYSKMLGTYTFKAVSTSRNKRGGGGSINESDQRRDLMLPQELKEMNQREQIIDLENTKAIKCEKIAYFAEPAFIDRLKSVSPSLKSLGNKLPNQKELERAWGDGECAITVPIMDMDLHEAKVHGRKRELTTNDIKDIEEGLIDLSAFAINTSNIPLPDPNSDSVSEEDLTAFTEGYISALYESSPEVDEDGSSPSISASELAQLDAEAQAETEDPEYEAVINDDNSYDDAELEYDEIAEVETNNPPSNLIEEVDENDQVDTSSSDEYEPTAEEYESMMEGYEEPDNDFWDDSEVQHPDEITKDI
jgi:type IV secretion system protein VirD4